MRGEVCVGHAHACVHEHVQAFWVKIQRIEACHCPQLSAYLRQEPFIVRSHGMSTDTFENLLSHLERHVVSHKVAAFDLDAVLASAQALRSERQAMLSSLLASEIAEVHLSALICFDVVAVASAIALHGNVNASATTGDPQTALVDMWGGAQAARTLWGDHFLFSVSPAVEGRLEAIEETARVLGGQAVNFSLQTGRSAPQFADFVAKALR
jgi:hypothetical protein